jgi:hypothetical protein
MGIQETVPSMFSREVETWIRQNEMSPTMLVHLDARWRESAHTVMQKDVFHDAMTQCAAGNQTMEVVLLWLRAADLLQHAGEVPENCPECSMCDA